MHRFIGFHTFFLQSLPHGSQFLLQTMTNSRVHIMTAGHMMHCRHCLHMMLLSCTLVAAMQVRPFVVMLLGCTSVATVLVLGTFSAAAMRWWPNEGLGEFRRQMGMGSCLCGVGGCTSTGLAGLPVRRDLPFIVRG